MELPNQKFQDFLDDDKDQDANKFQKTRIFWQFTPPLKVVPKITEVETVIRDVTFIG